MQGHMNVKFFKIHFFTIPYQFFGILNIFIFSDRLTKLLYKFYGYSAHATWPVCSVFLDLIVLLYIFLRVQFRK